MGERKKFLLTLSARLYQVVEGGIDYGKENYGSS